MCVLRMSPYKVNFTVPISLSLLPSVLTLVPLPPLLFLLPLLLLQLLPPLPPLLLLQSLLQNVSPTVKYTCAFCNLAVCRTGYLENG